MAIIQLNDCGESYDTATAPEENWASFNSSSGAAVFTDGSVGQAIASGNNGGFIYTTSIPFPASSTVIVTFRAKAASNNSLFVVFSDGASANTFIDLDNANRFKIRGTAVITGSLPFNPTTGWHFYEFKYSANVSSGIFEVRVDGVIFATFSGVQTATSIFSTALAGWNANMSFRDLVILDTTGPSPNNNYIGDVSVKAIYPTSDATPNNFTNDFGGSHFSQLNSVIPPGDSHFIHDNVVNDRENFGFPNLPGAAQVVYAVMPKASCKKVSGSTRTLAFGYDDGMGGVSYGTDFAVGAGTYTEYSPDITLINPNTGLQWSVSDVNSTKFGFKITS